MNHLDLTQLLERAPLEQEPRWLYQQRTAARERLKALDLSTQKEEWQFLSQRPFFEPLQEQTAPPIASPFADARVSEDCLTLTLQDGRLIAPSTQTLPKGLRIRPLQTALREDKGPLEALFTPPDSDSRHALTDLVLAFAAEGLLIEVEDDVTISSPIRIRHQGSAQGRLSTHQHLLIVGRNAEATLIETFEGPDHRPYVSASMTRIHLETNARLDHYKLQLEGNDARHFGGLSISQAPQSVLRQTHIALGGRFARTEIHCLLEKGAECHLEGSFIAQDQAVLDTHTRLRHRGQNASSRNRYQGIALGKGRGIFQGRIIVELGAQKTDAVMQSRNLLLSEDAVIDAKPQLEIHADDVKCAHGVSVGQIDPEQIFYLTSRGVDKADAIRLLTLGFASTILDQIRPEALRLEVKEQIDHTMEKAILAKDPS